MKKCHNTLANCVISLHQQGYIDDFQLIESNTLQCLQTGAYFMLPDIHIRLIYCDYDVLTHSIQYIHAIDTQIGFRGILIMNGILPLHN